jgi:glycerol-3-phosphate acyltransferase PlsX
LKIITIAVDAMGGDHGPPVIVPAAGQVLAEHKNLHLVLVGDRDVLEPQLRTLGSYDLTRLTIQHASQRVEMDESPAVALRSKKDSSMRVAINLVKEGRADACVSAGNTGALMATARFVLKTLPGIDRPAIISSFPTIQGNKVVRMLDLGANVDSTAENLFQFAVMGSVLASAVDNIQNPKVCLLNIGEEDIKGNELVKQAAALLSQSSQLVNYAGYVEGDRIYKGEVDVVVCDGFVGNVALKVMEGVASMITKLLKDAFKQNIFTKLVALLVLPILKGLKKRIDPDRYNGATLLGLQGIVIKSHGGAKQQAFAHAIEAAMIQADKGILQRISSEIEQILKLSSLGTAANNIPKSQGEN